MTILSRPVFSKILLSITIFLANNYACAAKPAALAIINGELRNFSPDGRYAAVVDKNMLAVYETSKWEQVSTIAVNPGSRFRALLIDNQQQLAGVYDTASNQRRLEIWDFKNGLKSLGVHAAKGDRAAVLTSSDTIAIEGFSQVYMGRSTVYRSPKEGILQEGDRYHWFSFTCAVDKYFEVAPRLSPVMSQEDADTVQRFCTKNSSGGSTGGEVSFNITQSDLGVSQQVNGMRYTGHPSTGPGEFVRKVGDQNIKWFSSRVVYETTNKSPDSDLKEISTPDYILLSGQPYQVLVKASDDPFLFDLKQLEIPGFVPQRVSPDARLIAFSNGQTTRIYTADVVTDEYANLDPGVKQDLLMQKISNAFTANRPSTALSYFQRLAQMGKPLPESFYYYQIQALVAAGDMKDRVREEAEAYLRKFGKKGKYYAHVISILSRL